MRKLLLSVLGLALLGGAMYAGPSEDERTVEPREEIPTLRTQGSFEHALISNTRWIKGNKIKSASIATLAVLLYMYGPKGVLALAKSVNSWWCGCPVEVEECDEAVETAEVVS
ncbi:hypothetical protein JW872_02030 [Candidatus Babeliales bacterium]|nr:hypothetical protein [Candidatus Babeliales bacterium]